MARVTGIAMLAIVVSTLSGALATAQDCAAFQSSGGSGSWEWSCSGNEPYQTVFFTGNGNASLTIECAFNAWRVGPGPSEYMALTTTHTCGQAGAGEPPVCWDPIFGPVNRGWDGSNVQADMYGATMGWNGQDCTLETVAHTYAQLYHTGCDNGFCCSLETQCTAVGEWMPGCKCQLSPIVIDLDSQGVQLTDRARGVNFDLNRDGRRERLAWTRGDREDAFLVWDRNENGRIDDGGELFGSVTDQPPIDRPNGFNALSVLDENLDGIIDSRDSRFSELRLWVDRDHDGWSRPGELYRLHAKGVRGLYLDYRESRREDRFGNVFRYWARVQRDNAMTPPTWAVDVFLIGGVSESGRGPGAATSCVRPRALAAK